MQTRLRGGLVLASLLFFAPQTSFADVPAETALKQWIAEADASPGLAVTYRAISYDAAADTTTILGLSLKTEQLPGIDVSVESLQITGYAATADGGFAAKALRADSAAVKIGFADIALGDVNLEDLAGPAWQWQGYDPAKPFTSLMGAYSEAIKGRRIGHGRIGSLEIIEQLNGLKNRISYGTLEFSSFADGKIGSTSAGPLKLEAALQPQGLMTMTIGGVETRDIDLGAFVHVYDPSEYVGGAGDMIWRNAFGSAVYSDIRVAIPDAAFSIREARVEGIKLRQPRHSFAEFIDQAMIHPDQMDAANKDALVHQIVDMLSAGSVGRIAFSGMSFEDESIGRLAIGDIHLNDLSIDGLGEFGIGDLDVASPDFGTVKMGRFAFGGITFPSVEAIETAIAASEQGGEPDTMTLIARLGFFELGAVDVQTPDIDHVALDRFRLDLGDYVGPVPTRVVMDLSGLQIPSSAVTDSDARAMLARLGYDNIDVHYGLSAHWTEADQTVTVDNFDVGLKGIVAVTDELRALGSVARGNRASADARQRTPRPLPQPGQDHLHRRVDRRQGSRHAGGEDEGAARPLPPAVRRRDAVPAVDIGAEQSGTDGHRPEVGSVLEADAGGQGVRRHARLLPDAVDESASARGASGNRGGLGERPGTPRRPPRPVDLRGAAGGGERRRRARWIAGWLERPRRQRAAGADAAIGQVGRFSRMCSSRSCFAVTSDGAPISRSSARWFIGKSVTSRRFSSPQSSMTMRSTPGAMPPCGGAPYCSARSMPPNFCSSTSSP